MYVLMAYDVIDGRTEIFRKLLTRYLVHEQKSVFAGDITESQLIKLRGELKRICRSGDSMFELIASNRHNVSVSLIGKEAESDVLVSRDHDHHARSAMVI